MRKTIVNVPPGHEFYGQLGYSGHPSNAERLHPDGLPVSATPESERCVPMDMRRSNVEFAALERRAREAEARVAELERELAAQKQRGDHYRDTLVARKPCHEAALCRVAELEREVAYQTRRAYEAMDYMTLSGQRDFKQDWPEQMPEGWRPQGDNEQSERKP